MRDSSPNPPSPSDEVPQQASTSEDPGSDVNSRDKKPGTELAEDEASAAELASVRAERTGPERARAGRRQAAESGQETGMPEDEHQGVGGGGTRDPLLGTTLHDTYVVARVLGEGGMGRVYEAHHTRIRSKRYAIKVLHPEFSLNAEIRLRFQREAEAAATIEHDGVVGTYDLGETPDGWPYMVCEYLAGTDLNEYIKAHGALPARSVVHIGSQLCSALSAAHSRGVIHRDLKPHNVFVLQPSETPAVSCTHADEPQADLPAVKVLDFGLSRFLEGDNELTKTGIILGTPGYMAPEQANGRHTDLRTDIYGIGALLYTAATGLPPFKAETPQLTVLAVMSQEPRRPCEVVASIPGELEIVIQKAMAREPSDRYQSADEMKQALTSLYAASTPLNRRGDLSRSGPSLPPRLSLVLYALAAFFLGGVALLGAALSVMEIKGVHYAEFRPSSLEWLLFALLFLLILFLLSLVAQRLKQRVWNNSARVAALVPRFRAPLVAAVLAYGLSALLIRAGATAIGASAGSLTHSDLPARLVLFIILPVNAALAAGAVLLRDAFRTAQSSLVRAATGLGSSLGALIAGLFLLASALVWPPPVDSPTRVIAIPPAPITDAGVPSAAAPAALAERQAPSGRVTRPPEPDKPDGDSAEKAPKDDLAIAMEGGAQTLSQLAKGFPLDGQVQKALVLAHASRADTLDASVHAIARLLTIDAEFKSDPDVLFILKKALRTQGGAYKAAASILKNQMGDDAAELLYQMMSEYPAQRSQLRTLFLELRKTKQASPALLVAYDLSYAASCRARLEFLARAEQYGDVRSLRQLQALSTAPKRCGWGRTCYPPCRAEADQFQRSAKIISARLAAAR